MDAHTSTFNLYSETERSSSITQQYLRVYRQTQLILLHLVSKVAVTVGQIRQGPCTSCCHHPGPHWSVLPFVYRAKIKARKFRVDGFTIEAFACQLHLGDVTAVLPEEEEDPGKHVRPPTDPTDRHSPSPGTTSGTTQSAPAGSSPDEPPIQG